MNADQVAARFDNRPGYTLVDFGEVGLPLFLINAISIVQEPKNLHPIEEFVLRSSRLGLAAVSDVSGFLGLDSEIIDRVLISMIQEELVLVDSESAAGESIRILPKGFAALSEAGLLRPETRTLSFVFDGLTRKPKYVEQTQLLFPRELKDAGIPEIPALPGRGPDVDELNVLEVEDVVQLGNRTIRRAAKILKIKSIESRNRCFLPAVALVYKSEIGADHRVLFAIGGRLSEDHERAFATADGLNRCQRFAGLKSSGPPNLANVIGDEIAASLPAQKFDNQLRSSLSQARTQVALALQKGEAVASNQQDELARNAVEKAQAELAALEQKMASHVVRPLPVYDHANLLSTALKSAVSRLLIISPWIRRAVVSREIVKQIEGLLKKGVMVHIGYGIGDIDSAASKADRDAEKELQYLCRTYPNFVFERFGNTHAKILIKDSDYFVITSFNWLSFRGDPARTFREEWGTLVAIPESVDNYYNQMVERFSKA